MKDLFWIALTVIYGILMLIPAEQEYQKRLEIRKQKSRGREEMDSGPFWMGLWISVFFFLPVCTIMRFKVGVEPYVLFLICAAAYTWLGIYGGKVHG